MLDELEQGDEIELFLIFLGSHKPDNELDMVFLVNAYR
jgi:hypothetical protein